MQLSPVLSEISVQKEVALFVKKELRGVNRVLSLRRIKLPKDSHRRAVNEPLLSMTQKQSTMGKYLTKHFQT